MQTAAFLICLILFALSVFQVLLILGYPLGHFAWGGQHKILPRNLRIGSITSLFIYAFIASVVLDRAGVISIYAESFIRQSGIWILIIYFGLGILLNGISRSKAERFTMTPIVTALFLLALYIALNN